jgi:hypothetical protein
MSNSEMIDMHRHHWMRCARGRVLDIDPRDILHIDLVSY